MGPEARIRHAVKDFFLTLHFSVWDMEQNRKTRQTPGFSDLVVCGHGMVIFAEIKTPTGRQSIDQKVFQLEVEKNGGIYIVLRSVKDAWDFLAAKDVVKEALPCPK